MNLSSRQVNSLVNKALTGYTNARERQDIIEKIVHFGYSDEHLGEEIEITNQVFEKAQTQKLLYGDFTQLQKTFILRLNEEKKRYQGYRKMAKLKFVGNLFPFREILRINQPMKRTFSGFIAQASDLYDNIIKRPTILEKLQDIGFTIEKMQQGLDKIAELKQLESKKISIEGDAQRATRIREDAFNDLKNRFSSFVTASKICLEDFPQLREVLGIMERSSPIRKKKTAEPTDTTGTTDPPILNNINSSLFDITTNKGALQYKKEESQTIETN